MARARSPSSSAATAARSVLSSPPENAMANPPVFRTSRRNFLNLGLSFYIRSAFCFLWNSEGRYYSLDVVGIAMLLK